MSKLSGQIAALGAVLLTGVTLAACGSSGIPGNAVVSVNGTPITNTAFNHWMTVAAGSSAAAATTAGQTAPKAVVPDPPTYKACIAHLEATAPKPAKGQSKPTAAALKSQCEQQYASLKQQVLGYLISANWVIGEASERGVKVSDAEVQKQFNQIKAQQFPKEADFQKFLASTGYTVSDLLLRVKLDLLSSKIQAKVSKEAGKKPSQKEISAYYEQHKSQYGQPEKRNILIVLTKTLAQAEKAKKELESGKSFATVAKSSSIDPVSKAAGGSLPGVTKGQEEKALDEAVFKAQVNVLGGPIKTPFGYYVYEVKKTIPGSQQALSKVQSSIQQQITAQKQQKALSEFVKEFRKKWTARTECRNEYSVMDCKAYKAPKTSTLPSTATPTTATPQTTTPTTTSSSGSTTAK
ncbi:MAG TPA: peptidyl-prolyl cis-trans isomerase [Solirubrobacteraceae bacterium]|nr:peptidyl-prolyl cis-trans isomerase [Solirubrobacteraceae bacterium]